MQLQAIVVDQPQHHQCKSATDHAQQQFLPRGALLALPSYRVRRCDARYKQKKGKDQIIKMKSIPKRMLELVGKGLHERTTGDPGKGLKDLFTTHDPEHVESTEGIERIQSLRRGCLGHTTNI